VEDKTLVDWTAVSVALGAFFELLPAISALLSIVWLSLRIYQTVKEIKKFKG
jgi:hypothetical protein